MSAQTGQVRLENAKTLALHWRSAEAILDEFILVALAPDPGQAVLEAEQILT